ncbi:MAG: hypothetical protein GY853_00435 [PVC group bacterium]|nr:hypothetical protein [PVC group bacterium]
MRTGISYMGHHNPKHVAADLEDIKALGCDDVLLACQENDFVYMRGKPDFFPALAKNAGIRPLMILWGALNLFGGGKSSQFLLDNPQTHQVHKDGSYDPAGCYNNQFCVEYIKKLIDYSIKQGFKGYFIDEPSLLDCYCLSCQQDFELMFGQALHDAETKLIYEFRRKCVVNYVKTITEHVKLVDPNMETLCCVMPRDRVLWASTAGIETLDNLGTDIYWVNEDTDIKQMSPMVNELACLCRDNNKKHHQWLQAWGVQKGREMRIREQGEVLLREKPDTLYVWAYQAQLGTSETCEDPAASWAAACKILKKAKGI